MALQYTHSESISEHIATVLCSLQSILAPLLGLFALPGLSPLLCHHSKKTMVEGEQEEEKQKQHIIVSVGVGEQCLRRSRRSSIDLLRSRINLSESEYVKQ